MNPNNFIPGSVPSRHKQVMYTDGTPSREIEDESAWSAESEELQDFKKGFGRKKPSIVDIRDNLNKLHCLLDVISASLMTDDEYMERIRIYEVIQSQILPKIKELEQELARI